MGRRRRLAGTYRLERALHLQSASNKTAQPTHQIQDSGDCQASKHEFKKLGLCPSLRSTSDCETVANQKQPCRAGRSCWRGSMAPLGCGCPRSRRCVCSSSSSCRCSVCTRPSFCIDRCPPLLPSIRRSIVRRASSTAAYSGVMEERTLASVGGAHAALRCAAQQLLRRAHNALAVWRPPTIPAVTHPARPQTRNRPRPAPSRARCLTRSTPAPSR